MKTICLVTTSPLIVNFFLLPFLASLGRVYRVSLAVNPDVDTALADGHGAEVIALPIRRKISPWSDLRTLARMIRLFRERQFDAIHSFSPKAGLLAMVAAWIARIPVRIHVFQGEVWLTRKGGMRLLLKFLDRLVARLATHVQVVSHSEREFLIREGIIGNAKSRVLGSGSLSGVDAARFRPDSEARAAVRAELGIAPEAMVFLFLGRLTRDKGVLDLAQAFASLAAVRPAAVLLLVGPDEERVRPKIESICRAHAGKLRFAGYTRTPERYIAAANALCLPSYREGFPTVIIEAAATGIPATGSRIYGITDAIIEGETGLLHTPADAKDLAKKMEMLMNDPALRERLGTRARQRAVDEFSQQRLTQALLDYYRVALGE